VRIVNERSGRVFDVAGTDVQLWDADPARRQEFALRPAGRVLLPALGLRRTWRFHRAELGYATITPAGSDRELAADGRLVRRGRGARWAVLPTADGTFRLTAREGGELATKVVLPRLPRRQGGVANVSRTAITARR